MLSFINSTSQVDEIVVWNFTSQIGQKRTASPKTWSIFNNNEAHNSHVDHQIFDVLYKMQAHECTKIVWWWDVIVTCVRVWVCVIGWTAFSEGIAGIAGEKRNWNTGPLATVRCSTVTCSLDSGLSLSGLNSLPLKWFTPVPKCVLVKWFLLASIFLRSRFEIYQYPVECIR